MHRLEQEEVGLAGQEAGVRRHLSDILLVNITVNTNTVISTLSSIHVIRKIFLEFRDLFAKLDRILQEKMYETLK